MKKLKLILPLVAAVLLLVVLVVLGQAQASYSASNDAFIIGAKSQAPIKTGYEMAFDKGTQNYFGIIPVGAIIAIVLIALSYVPTLKKYSNILVVSAATIAICAFGVYLSNIGSSKFLADTMNKVPNANFKVNGTAAYYIGIISCIVASLSLYAYAVLDTKK